MSGQEAKYQQVVDWVKEQIENGTFRSGDRLMSENELSERFGLSRQTIRRATGELVSQKLVTRIQGSGTYIRAESTAGSAPSQEPAVRARTRNIAVISTFSESYIFPNILKGIDSVLSENGYSMQVTFTDNRLSREAAILRLVLERNDIDGLIVEPVKSALPNPNITLYKKILSLGIPILFFNTFYPELDVPCVRIDDTRAAVQATRHLIENGHRRIGAILKTDDGQGPRRYTGYLEEMNRAGLKTDQDSVIWLDSPASSDMSQFRDYLLGRLSGCSAVVCYNDLIAYQLINLALEAGIRVPEELSVVGIDDSYLAGVCRVPFTSVIHPKEQLGKKAAENLLCLIRDPSFDAGCLMETKLCSRDSVAVLQDVRLTGIS